MTTLDTLTLYERILSNVSASELHRSSISVLQEEYSTLDKAVDDVVAIYAKVEEVRDAVNQLNQGKASTGRSDTLLEVMDSTLQLQQELHNTLKTIGSGMKVVDLKLKKEKKFGKRQRDEADDKEDESSSDSSSSSSSSSDDDSNDDKDVENGEEDEVNTHKKQNHVVAPKQSKVSESAAATASGQKGSDLSLAHKSLDTISDMKVVNQRIELQMKGMWSETLLDLTLILKRQSRLNTDTADEAAVKVAACAFDSVVKVFKGIKWTPTHAKELRALLAVLSDACSKNKTLRVYFHRVRAELECLEMSIPRSIAEPAAMSLNNQLLFFQELVDKVAVLPSSVKPKRIIDALDVMQHAMANDPNCARHAEVRYSSQVVKHWIGAVPFQNDLGDEFETYAYNLAEYGKSLSGETNRDGWQRLADDLLKLLNQKREQTTKTSQAPPTVSKATKAMQDRLKAMIADVEQWQDGIFSLSQLEKAVRGFGEVMSYQSKDWNPLADANSRVCMDKLIHCIQLIKKQAHRDKNLKAMNKWKKSIVVQA